MAWVPTELQGVKEDIDAGKSRSETVRQLLAWFDQERRGRHVVSEIRQALRKMDLVTVPDFDATWMDGSVRFEPRSSEKSVAAPVVTTTPPPEPNGERTDVDHPVQTAVSVETEPDQVVAAPVRTLEGQDPSYSVGKVDAANRAPVSVNPNTSVMEAITLMLAHDYSQLPVIQGDRSVKGLFSWKSYGSRLALKQPCEKVGDAMEGVQTISAEASIFQVAELLAEDAVVLVQKSATDTKIVGIVATSDVAEQFGSLGEPFLLIGEIENRVRLLIDGKFTIDELSSVKDTDDIARQIESVADLTFGEYVRLLQKPTLWEKCLPCVARAVFVKHLDEVREIRNDVMHFDPDGVDPAVVKRLRKFAQFLKKLAELEPQSP